MKKLSYLFLLLFFYGCGSLRVNPKNCKSNAVWGENPASVREINREQLAREKTLSLKAKESFYVFSDRDLRIRDLLEEHGVKCEDVKKIRVEVKTSWFIRREVTLKVVLN